MYLISPAPLANPPDLVSKAPMDKESWEAFKAESLARIGIYYTLDENNRVVECSPDETEKILRNIKRRQVGEFRANGALVSTVFLGIDHAIGMSRPMFFETMVFDENSKRPFEDLACERYETWEEAAEGHERWVVEARDPGFLDSLKAERGS